MVVEPLKIGTVLLEKPVILAPMSGVTDLPFRRLAQGFGAGMVVSEMIASNEALRSTDGTTKRLHFAEGPGPRSVQLAGHDAEAMAETARYVVDNGAEIVDLNFGCPAKKVTSKYCGSALMQSPEQSARIIGTVARAVSVPVTVKMRTGWCNDVRNAPEIARIAEAEGAQMITVHGRTREQKYTGTADWHFVQAVRDAIQIPLIINGDITNSEEARQAMKSSGAQGVMIGRAAYGRPWIVGSILKALETGRTENEPDLGLRLRTVLQHYDAMLAHHGVERGIRASRKHLGWSIHGLPGAAKAREVLMKETRPEKVRETVQTLFHAAMEQEVRDDLQEALVA